MQYTQKHIYIHLIKKIRKLLNKKSMNNGICWHRNVLPVRSEFASIQVSDFYDLLLCLFLQKDMCLALSRRCRR